MVVTRYAIRHRAGRAVIAALIGLGAVTPAAVAQPPRSAARAETLATRHNVESVTVEPVRRAIARAPFGDAAVMVNARDDGIVEVAVAGPQRSNVLEIGARDARDWADSARRLIDARALPRTREGSATARAFVEERKANGGGVSLTRKATRTERGATETEWTLFFADSAFGGFGTAVEREEARIFVATLRRAALAAQRLQAEKARPTPIKRPPRRAVTPR